jgi:hypothetical protein
LSLVYCRDSEFLYPLSNILHNTNTDDNRENYWKSEGRSSEKLSPQTRENEQKKEKRKNKNRLKAQKEKTKATNLYKSINI